MSFDGSPEELADRLALARTLAGGGLSSSRSTKAFEAVLVDEAASEKKTKKKTLPQRRASSMASGFFGGSPFFGGSSLFDALLGRALPSQDQLSEEEEETSHEEDSEEETVSGAHPLHMLFNGLFGGGQGLDADALESLLRGEGPVGEGEEEEPSGVSSRRRSKKKSRQLPFKAVVEQNGEGQGAAETESYPERAEAGGGEDEQDPRLRRLIQKAREKGNQGLVSVLSKACAVGGRDAAARCSESLATLPELTNPIRPLVECLRLLSETL